MGAAHLLPLVIAVPIVVACVGIAWGKAPRMVLDIGATATAAAIVALDAVVLSASGGRHVVTWSGGWVPSRGLVGIVLVADPVSAALALVVAALVFCASLYSWRYVESSGSHYHVLVLLFLAGMEGFVLSGDLFDMFVFFELMGAVAYALTGFKVEDSSAVQGGLNFAIINSYGAYLSLAGVGLLYARTSELGLAQIHRALIGHPLDALVVTAFLLVLTGFLVKAAMVPYHFWLSDAHAVAPTSICVLFSGVMVELGVYAVARVYWVVFDGVLPADDIRRAFIVLGALTAVLGAIMCFAQRHLKRLLAYSTISHVGLFLCAFGTLSPDGTAGAIIYVLGHAGIKSALFLLVGIALNRYGSVDEVELHGRGRDDHLTGWLFIAGGLALADLPPFGTAFGKAISEAALQAAGYGWGPALYVFAGALTGGAVIRAALGVYFGLGRAPGAGEDDQTKGEEEPDVTGRLKRIPPTMLIPILVLLAGGLAVGVVPQAASGAGEAAQWFVHPASYIGQVLGHPPSPHFGALPDVAWTASGVGLGVLSAVLGIGVALVGLYSDRLPHPVRDLGNRGRPVLGGLRKVHSGHVGDYAAWLLFGLAGMAALVGLPLR